jgi:hypothetical protein
MEDSRLSQIYLELNHNFIRRLATTIFFRLVFVFLITLEWLLAPQTEPQNFPNRADQAFLVFSFVVAVSWFAEHSFNQKAGSFLTRMLIEYGPTSEDARKFEDSFIRQIYWGNLQTKFLRAFLSVEPSVWWLCAILVMLSHRLVIP